MTRFVYVKFRNEDEPRKIEADEVVQTGIPGTYSYNLRILREFSGQAVESCSPIQEELSPEPEPEQPENAKRRAIIVE